jgi:hypothetical protein
MSLAPPLNLPRWLEENSDKLQPPINNFCLYSGKDYVVMAVGGPNERNDFHVNETEARLVDTTQSAICDRDCRNGFTNTRGGCYFE